jgi:serine/threonine protein kinase
VKRFIGRILDQRYRIDQFIGEGARGAVFQGYDLDTQREVAIKILNPNFAGQPELEPAIAVWRQTAPQLNHPNIAKTLHIKIGNPSYIVAELLVVANLRQQLAAPNLVERLQVLQQACLILDYIHQQHIFHRELKPENIFVGPLSKGADFSKPILSDVGLPSFADLGYERMLNVEGSIKTEALRRTLTYLSPEQARGQAADARSDIYALGVMLYEMATEEAPFEVNTVSQARRKHSDALPQPPRSRRPDLPEALEQIILKALAKNPDDRYQSAAELAEVLAKVISHIRSTATESNGNVAPPPKPVLAVKPSLHPAEPKAKVSTEPAEAKPEPIKIDYNVAGYLFVTPGESTPFAFVITNQTDSIKDFDLSIEGIPTAWVTNLPSRLELNPYQAREIRLNVEPPLSSASRAGQHTLIIQVRSSQLPGIKGTMAKPIVLSRFIQFSCELLSEKKRLDAGSVGRVGIHNQGNSAETFLVRWNEESGKLKFKPAREKVHISAGKKVAIPFVAVPDQALTIGAMPLIQNLERHAFTVSVSLDDENKVCEGEITTHGLIPTRFGFYFVTALLLLTLACALLQWVFVPPEIENVVLNPLQPNCHQPFAISWLINQNAWGVKVDVLANSMRIAAGLGPREQYYFPEGVPQPYTLSVEAYNWFGRDTQSVRVCGLNDATLTVSPLQVTDGASAIAPPDAPIMIPEGAPILVQWSTLNAKTVMVEPFGILQPEEFSGSRIDAPRRDTTYRLTATNGTDPPVVIERVVKVIAGSAPQVEFKVEPSVITLGQDKLITITWQLTNTTSAAIQPDIGTIFPCDPALNLPCNQRVIAAPTRDTIYTLVAQNTARVITSTAKVTTVRAEKPEIIDFTAAPPVVVSGVNQSVKLIWSTKGAAIVRIEPDIGVMPPSGSIEIPAPVADATYTLSAENSDMPADVRSVTIKVQAAPTPVVNSFTVVGDTLILIDQDNRDEELEIVLSWDVSNVTANDQVTITRNFDGKKIQGISGTVTDRVPAVSRTVVYTLFARNNYNLSATASVEVTIQKRQ